jgi:putative ABC transport system permease protein
MKGRLSGNDFDAAVTNPEMAGAIVKEIPEIEEAVRLTARGESTLNYNNRSIECGQLIFADPGFFSFFGIHIEKTLQDPFESENNITISKSIAEKHFGSVEGAMNKVVKLRGDNCIITGVFDDFPKNFHLQTNLIQSIKKTKPDEIGWNGGQAFYTYFRTNTQNIDNDALSFKLTKTVYSHSNESVDGTNAESWDDLKGSDELYLFYLAEPLKDIHFGNHRFDPAVTSNKTYVYGAIILAFLVLLISSINFLNLSIANISTRLKEFGIRKTTGAHNNQIAIQLLLESILFLVIGFVLAVSIYRIGGQPLAKYLDLDINISNAGFIKIVILSFIALLLFNVIANIIPVFFISKKRVLSLVKEEKSISKGFSIKDSFVSLQFILSALIILSSIIVQKQINFIINKDRGYDSENVLMLSMWSVGAQKRKTFIDDLKSNSVIESVSTGDTYFGYDPSMNGAFFDTQEDENYFHTSTFPVDDEFFNTFNIKIKEGRSFDKEKKTDFNSALLNEAAWAKYSGTGSLIGHKLLFNGNTYDIIGIIKDFNFRSLYHKVQPLVFRRVENRGNVFIKIRNSQIPQVVALLKQKWKEYNIPSPLEYDFHDQIIASHYAKDQQAKKLLLILSIISIIISCVGLYAISYFTIIRKTKEIGIRKVNGATISELMQMLNLDFLKWVIVAFLIATPVAYFAMSKWLENFAYKTELSWWIFALAGILALGISLITISWQSWKAATRNPVEALRYE